MEIFLTFALLCLMIVIGCSSYWIYVKTQDFLQWYFLRQDRKRLQRTLKQATTQAYSRRLR